MGYASYSCEDRGVRASSMGYFSKSDDEIFTQNAEQMIHESMNPKQALLRECRDSEAHPNTVPIILSLDVTGSMGKIPMNLIQHGLPNMMSSMIQNGVKDAALLFLAVGDHECDHAPLQVGQFESGDAELDTWLTRTWLEGRGGANEGESYLLPWYFAANHTSIDSFDKRGEKGFLFTIGDEPSLKNLPANVITGLMGDGAQKGFTDAELLEAARKKYHVFHLHITETSAGSSHETLEYWQQLLGANRIPVDDYRNIPTVVSDIVIKTRKATGHRDQAVDPNVKINDGENKPSSAGEGILL